MTPLLIFTDSDFDDTLAVGLAVAQHQLGAIQMVGIVCDDGFLTFPENVHWMSYWVKTVLQVPTIPVVEGIPREEYLASQRFFPASWVQDYLGILHRYYGAWPSVLPDPASSILELIQRLPPHSLDIVELGPVTTLSVWLTVYPWFASKIRSIWADTGVITPTYTITPVLSVPSETVNTDWNAFLNPDGLARMIYRPTYRVILTSQECTEKAVYTPETVAAIIALSVPYPNSETSVQVLLFLERLLELEIEEQGVLSLWDVATMLLYFQQPMNQRFEKKHGEILWTGKTQLTRACPTLKVYTDLETLLYLPGFVNSLFVPVSSSRV